MTAKDKQQVFFSVVIPVYNRIEELARSLDSVQAQTERDFEIIVIDDGSEAGFAIQIENLCENQDNCHLIRHEQNLNGAHARNTGIRSAKGKYICLLDSDDEWAPDKLAIVRSQLQSESGLRVIYHQYQNVAAETASPPLPLSGILAGQSVAEYSFCVNRGGGIQSSCLTIESSLAKQVLFNEKLRGHQDWDFALRLGAETDHIAFIKAPLTLRYISDDHGKMVSKGLSYDFSLQFLREYQKYFSLSAQAAYEAFVLTPRRLLQYPQPPKTRYQFLAWLYYPTVMWQAITRLWDITMRCKKLVFYCRNNKIQSICLVGYNNYSRYFVGRYKSHVPIKLIVDRHRQSDGEIQVDRAENVQAAAWKNIDLVVTMTDHHHESMQSDLKAFGDFNFYTF